MKILQKKNADYFIQFLKKISQKTIHLFQIYRIPFNAEPSERLLCKAVAMNFLSKQYRNDKWQ